MHTGCGLSVLLCDRQPHMELVKRNRKGRYWRMRTGQEWRKNRFEEGPNSGEIDGQGPPGRDGRCDGTERPHFDKPPYAHLSLHAPKEGSNVTHADDEPYVRCRCTKAKTQHRTTRCTTHNVRVRGRACVFCVSGVMIKLVAAPVPTRHGSYVFQHRLVSGN